jgi:hypothetical protein
MISLSFIALEQVGLFWTYLYYKVYAPTGRHAWGGGTVGRKRVKRRKVMVAPHNQDEGKGLEEAVYEGLGGGGWGG